MASATISTRTVPSGQSSLFVTGQFPRRRWLVALLGVAGGLLLAWAWSANLVDDQIGFNSADTMLGDSNASTVTIGSIASGVLFAFVSGLAGSFTACNIVCFGAVGPMIGQEQTGRARLLETFKPLGWITAGMLPVSAIYGVIVGIVGTHMPQFSNAAGSGLSPRAIQSMVTFGVIGLVMIVLGLASLGVIPDPMAAVSRRFRNAPLVLMGALIGGFLIGRPYPLFHNLFRHAATTHNPLYGAVAFSLQSIGNIIVMSILFILISYVAGGRVQRWLAAKPSRISILTTAAFLVAGVFSVVYWDVRALARLGDLWFPSTPWH